MNDLIIELRELGINISGSLEDQVIKVINDYFNKLQQSQDSAIQDNSIKSNDFVQDKSINDDALQNEAAKEKNYSIQNKPVKTDDTTQNESNKADNAVAIQENIIENIKENKQDNKEIYTGAVGGYVRRAVKQHPSLWQAISKKYNY